MTAPQHFLYFFPLPQGHGSLRSTLISNAGQYTARPGSAGLNLFVWKNAVRYRGTIPPYESRAKPATHANRSRHAARRAFSPLLAAGAARRGAARARLPAGARAHARREADRFPRHAESARPGGRVLRASRRVALVRPQRGKRAALLLSRLEVRRHRPVRRDSFRAGQPEA